MRKLQNTSLATVVVLAVFLSLASSIFSFAQDQDEEDLKPPKPKPEYIQAIAQGTSMQMGRTVSVNIIIYGYSTDYDQKALIQAFAEKGNEGLNHALYKMKAKGRIAITGTLGYDLNYIRQFSMPDGSRRIRFVTDRPITFGEAWSSTRSTDYSLSGGEIILSKEKGKSEGTILPLCKFDLNKEKHLEIEAFQNPWKLTNILVRK